MYPWDNNNNTIDHHHHHRRRDHPHPSFSSSLLDQIYRSIDDSSDVSMRKKQNRAADENRVCLEKILVNRRKIADDFVRSRSPNPVFFKHSSSSSSDSSGFSSSESDSFYRRTRSSATHHPKPIRTTVERQLERPNSNNGKVKSKALKMYSDLKKVKQPISPGGRLATFLNSLFTGNAKKPNKTATSSSSTTTTTTCSSASSLSRSCLSKTTSSGEKSKRSVRFVLDEDSKQREEPRVMEENRRVIEAAKELIRTYQKSKEDVVNISGEEGEYDDDDDAASCASSDLFELDNLSAIGIGRYREELPVYETTRLNTNRIISR